MDGGDLPYLLDLVAILEPIPDGDPSGVDLRYEGTYDAIREARREDDAALPQGVWETSIKRADWSQVRDLCTEALKTRSKDLQIAVWLAEAMSALHGYRGTAEGIQCVGALAEQYWPTMFPPMDEDPELRIAPLEWLGEKLPQRLAQLALTQPTSGESEPFTWQQWQKAQRLEAVASSDPKTYAAAQTEGDVTVSRFLASVSLTPIDFYRAIARDLERLASHVSNLDDLIKELAGQDAPSFSVLREHVAAVRNWVLGALRDRGEPGIVIEEAPSEEGESEATAAAAASAGEAGPIASRDQAYRRLNEVADYLLRTEPHSPTPYLLKRAVSWGNMSLSQLLKELITEGDRKQLFKLLGMPE